MRPGEFHQKYINFAIYRAQFYQIMIVRHVMKNQLP